MALTKVSLLDDPLAMSYAANVAGNVSVTRSLAVVIQMDEYPKLI